MRSWPRPIGSLVAGWALLLVFTMSGGCASKPEVMPQDAFWNSVSGLCGKAYPGRVVVDSTASPTFADKTLTLHVRDCDDERLAMPLLIDGQPWVELILAREDGNLRLTHGHEGLPLAQGLASGYGGVTRAGGTPISQDFYATEFTVELQEDAQNTIWTIEIRPDAVLSYSLRREGTDRRFRAVFDLMRGRPAATTLR